jgi:hypothetical protein
VIEMGVLYDSAQYRDLLHNLTYKEAVVILEEELEEVVVATRVLYNSAHNLPYKEVVVVLEEELEEVVAVAEPS